MPQLTDRPLPPVFAAMAALDDAVTMHDLIAQRLAGAIEEGGRLEQVLRRADPEDQQKLLAAAQSFAFAIALVETLSRREEQTLLAVRRAQQALLEARKARNRERLVELRIEMEIDAATIWDMVGRFEAEVRARLEEHGKLASEMQAVAAAAGERDVAAPVSAMLAPALGTAGPALLNALAGGVRELHERDGSPGRSRAQPWAALASAVGQTPEPLATPIPARPPGSMTIELHADGGVDAATENNEERPQVRVAQPDAMGRR